MRGHLGDQDRPRFNTAYHSAEVRGKTGDEHDGDEWYTPRWLLDALGLTFTIDEVAA